MEALVAVKSLIIAEKPSVAADIAAALGGFQKNGQHWERDDTIVSSAVGHLVEIRLPEEFNAIFDLSKLPILPEHFALNIIPGTKSKFAELKVLMQRSDVDQVVNACDAGREGELIFRLIYEKAGCTKPMRRMWIRSMTREAIQNAHNNMKPGNNYDALATAARLRSEADLVLGINGTRGASLLRKQETGQFELYNAGRVQTPVLTLVVERQQAIKQFIAKPFWELVGHFKLKSGQYQGRIIGLLKNDPDSTKPVRIGTREKAADLLKHYQSVQQWTVHDTATVEVKNPPRLFDLTTLQRDANKRFRMSAKQTLEIAQALYERHKLTTYPRTDASCLPEDYPDECRRIMQALGNTAAYQQLVHDAVPDLLDFKPSKRIFNNEKISDHFAIIPTGNTSAELSEQEAKIYDLIVRRFLAAFFPAAIINVTTRITTPEGLPGRFITIGKVFANRGWMQVYADTDDAGQQVSEDKDKELCPLTPVDEGQAQLSRIELDARMTTPPKPYTEATLLSAMERAGQLVDDDELRDAMQDKGLGTPATRAAIIEGLLRDKDSRGNAKTPYLIRDGKAGYLLPTDKAVQFIDFLKANGIEALTSPKSTGEWEYELLQVQKGQANPEQFRNGIYQVTRDMMTIMRDKASTAENPTLQAPCPCCGKPMQVFFKGYKCSDEQTCKYVLWNTIAGRKITPLEAETLLATGRLPTVKGFASKSGKRFAAGLQLDEQHKLQFIFEEPKNRPALSTQFACKTCGKPLVHRTKPGKNGYNFWGCSGYKDGCKTSYPDKSGKPDYTPRVKRST